MESKEIWKDVIGYEGLYQVSDLGRIKSYYRGGKILKLIIDNCGYLSIGLYKKGNHKTRRIHQLVAESFLGHRPDGFKLVVNHKDINKTNNNYLNLEIVTNRENSNQKHILSTSKYIGVYWHKTKCKWYSAIRINKKKVHLGTFKCEFKAHVAYEKAKKELTI